MELVDGVRTNAQRAIAAARERPLIAAAAATLVAVLALLVLFNSGGSSGGGVVTAGSTVDESGSTTTRRTTSTAEASTTTTTTSSTTVAPGTTPYYGPSLDDPSAGVDTGPVGTVTTVPRQPTPGIPTSSTVASMVDGDLFLFREPTGEAYLSIGNTTAYGSPRTFLVKSDPGGDRVEVWLPMRPNGSSAWVERSELQLRSNRYYIEVHLGPRQLIVYDAGYSIVQATVAIGTSTNPTPAGYHYITDLISTGSTYGPYGPYAFGLSAHSETLSEFGNGDGQTGIHGTNSPGALGSAVSYGCVRLPNGTVEQLSTFVPLGTPVMIR